MIATNKRYIKSGEEYNSCFGKAKQLTINLPSADVYKTLELMENVVTDTLSQTTKIAQLLKRNLLNKTCESIFDFVYNHIQYKPDQFGVEQLRTPNRTWNDRMQGVDCDCYAIFVSSILTNLQIPHLFRITKYNGKSYFQHVYVIVPKHGKSITNRDSYYVIDPVLDSYNDEKMFSEKFDKAMKIPHQILNGVPQASTNFSFGNEFNRLSGLNGTDENFLISLKLHLYNTLKQLNKNPKAFANTVDTATFKEQLKYVLENWNDPIAREAALEEMREMEELKENEAETVLEEIKQVNGFGSTCSGVHIRKRVAPISTQGAKTKVELLRERRKNQKRVIPATIKRGTLQKEKKFNLLCECHMKNGLQGYYQEIYRDNSINGLEGFFSKVTSAVSKIGSTAKKVAQKVGDTAKKVGGAIVKYNPLTIAARNGLLLVMKLNLFGLANKLKWGYLTEAQAQAKNMNIVEWRKLKDTIGKMDKLFTTVGGQSINLKNAILSGKSGGINGLGVVVTATSTAAASGLVATITAWLKNIDFNKIFNTTKSVVNTVKQVHTTFIKPKPSLSPITKIALPANVTTPIITANNRDNETPSYYLPEHTVVASRPESKKSSTSLIIGVVVAGILGAIVYKKQLKPLNGIIENVQL